MKSDNQLRAAESARAQLQEQLDAARAEITRLEARGNRAVPVDPRPLLEPDQMTKALASLREDDPRWRAILQLLDEEIATATDRTCDKRAASDPGVVTHGAGGLCWLLDFRDKLVERRDQALRFAASDGGAGSHSYQI